MASINGFSVIPYGDPLLATYAIAGSGVRLSLRKEVAPLLVGLVTNFHRTVEPLDPKSCWGHAPRKIPGTDSWSFHAPAIAVDLNANQHPMGRRGTFTAGELAAVRALLAKYSYQGVRLFRWGGDYRTTADDMHFEIIVPRSVALQAVAALQAPAPPAGRPAPLPLPAGHRPGSRLLAQRSPMLRGEDVGYVQRFIGPARCGPVDGIFGPRTRAGVAWYQKMRGIGVDGIVGRITWSNMRITATF